MTEAEQREAARQFSNKWNGKGKEDEDDRSYWIDILENILDVQNVTDHICFQKKVIVDGNTKRIDAYIPETKVLIEQKSFGIKLDQKIHQSGDIDLTPYEQAKRYNDNLPYDEKARYIVTSNFAEIWIYDMNTRVPEPNVIHIENLQTECYRLSFLIEQKKTVISEEMQVSIKAGDIVGLLYDALHEQYENPDDKDSLKSLNMLCVRLVFCLYAEDAGLFGRHNMFHDYIEKFESQNLRKAVRDLFRILDQKPEERDKYLKDDDPLLAEFPYVNGGLFSDTDIEIPPFTDKIKTLIIKNACEDFDWSKISPTIFGAVFESTLNPETRRSGGMHYTSVENIHKVIDPLFLNDLKTELNDIINIDVLTTRKSRLAAYQDKLANLTFLDPACGSGNFLTETYLSLRRLENEVLKQNVIADNKQINGQISFASAEVNPIKISIQQFYGIEINDFAVTVAKTALWIAESQMMKETEDVVKINLTFLPLKSYVNIIEGNALSVDWESVVSKDKLSYIMGNPPFRGHRLRDKEQIADMQIMSNVPKYGKVDYVGAWFYKAAEYMQNTKIITSFVSTNSLCQGESVSSLWKYLIKQLNVEIQYAYNTFEWKNEASDQAAVHCIIVGYSCYKIFNDKIIFENNTLNKVAHINAYLQAAPDVFLESRGKCLTAGMPKMIKGNEATDGGNLSLTPAERLEIVSKYPQANNLIRKYIGSSEFINKKERYCIWLKNVAPSEYRNIPPIMERLEKVREFRTTNTTEAVHKLANCPMLFAQIRQPDTDFLLVPTVSSQRRIYVPMGFMHSDVIVNPKVLIVPDATLYLFGILESNVHMAWMRVVTGRLKSDFEYYPSVYNNFPFPIASDEQKEIISHTAQAILDARSHFPNDSLADLYDPDAMPIELSNAHAANDRAVMKLYGFSIKNMSRSDCVAALMKMYQEKVSE